jgi:hypothetical protein
MPKITDLKPIWREHVFLARAMCLVFIIIYPVWIFRAIWCELGDDIKQISKDYWKEAIAGTFGKYT